MKNKRWLIFILVLIVVLGTILCGSYVYNKNVHDANLAATEAKAKEEKRLQDEALKKEENRIKEEKSAQAIAAAKEKSANDAASKAADDAAAKAAALAAIVANPHASNFREFFKKDIFLGDSISEGLSFYEYLDENMVVAEKGVSVSKGIDYVDKFVALKPKRIFIMYGVNDMNDTTPSTWFVDQYLQLVTTIKQKLPSSEIYVQSVMPVIESIVHKTNVHITNVHINECNEGLKVMAAQQGINFLNVGSLLNDTNQDLYEGDGVHFTPKFYPIWLDYVESNTK